MTIFYVSTTITGAGNQFAFTATGDALVVLPNATLASTTSTAFTAGFGDIDVSVLGTMISTSQLNLTTNSSFTVATGATFMNFVPTASQSGLFMNGASITTQIDGTFLSPEAIGLLMSGGGHTVTVTGSLAGASGIFLLAGAVAGDVITNSGQITSGLHGDVSNTTAFNNAIYTEADNTRVTNLAGGTLSATSSQGNGIRTGVGSDGLSITNHGTILSVNAAAIDLSSMTVGAASLFNTGLVQGATEALNALGSGAAFTILNSGQMIGTVQLGSGNDSFDGRGGRLDGFWFGDAGDDRYDGRGASLISGTINGGIGNDTLLGGDGAEVINGDANKDFLRGGGGDDVLSGGLESDILAGDAGDDQLFGGDAVDDLSGGAGDDTLAGGDGSLTAHGGAGNDDLSVDNTITAVFTGGFGGAGDDTITGGGGNDLMDGGGDSDSLNGGNGNDTMSGGSGDDLLLGGIGNDSADGGTGDDTILCGGGSDRATGGSGNDALAGEVGGDTMAGGGGDDTLTGGASADLLTGGTGADVFVLALQADSGIAVGTRDQITDFDKQFDILDLSLMDADTTLGGNQAFGYIGSSAFSNTAGELQYVAATGILSGDTDGDGTQDFAIEFLNFTTLSAADFLL